MIKKLKLKLILCASAAVALLLTLIIGSINLNNYVAVTKDADYILSIIAQNRDTFPEVDIPPNPPNDKEKPPKNDKKKPLYISPDLLYEVRFFSLQLGADGIVDNIDTSQISSVNYADAVHYAAKAVDIGKNEGFVDRFRFMRYTEDGDDNLLFLDCGRMLETRKHFFIGSVSISFLGFVVVLAVLHFIAGRLIRPIAESYEKQKRFIADAGHEIKTPLTVINANAELLELDIGQNESIDDIRQQTERLRRLTDDLIYLSRMEERSIDAMTEFPLSDIVLESAEAFSARARSEGKELKLNITPMLSIKGNPRYLEQLLSIFLDNALKYSPQGDSITVELAKQGRSVSLSVANHVEAPLSEDDLSKIFYRFYRTDPSRNSQTGGHGIGLSIAKAIVEAHNGRISASMESNNIFRITASFTAQ